jgi:hypothetical protein
MMARNKKHTEDKFYTKVDVAKQLITLLNLDYFDIIIEPSAGDGSFSNNIEHHNLIAIDIAPENDNILKMNWFDFNIDYVDKKILIIGNPPFGNQGGLAIRFIMKADELKADTIAFILPKSFKKESIKNRIPLNYHLIQEIDLNDNSFELMGIEYSVPCIFQIWKRSDILRMKTAKRTTSHLIEFVSKLENPDYCFRRVGFYAGRIFDECDNKSQQSHYFIKSSNEVKEILKNYKWEHNNTAGPRSIGKTEIIKIIEEPEK